MNEYDSTMIAGNDSAASVGYGMMSIKGDGISSIDYDSIMTATDSNVINRTSYYKNGLSLPDNDIAMAERAYSVGNDNFISLGMLSLFIILTIVLSNNRATIAYRIKDFMSPKRTYMNERSNNNVKETLCIFLLMLISSLSISALWANPLMEKSIAETTLDAPFWLYAIGSAIILTFVYVKIQAYTIINWVFFNNESCKRWTSSYLFLASVTAIILYPAAIVSTYVPEAREVASLVVILAFILYEILIIYKLFVNFKIKRYGYMLIFFYFCSVELVPTLAIWQLASYLSGYIIEKNLLY